MLTQVPVNFDMASGIFVVCYVFFAVVIAYYAMKFSAGRRKGGK